MKKKGKKARLHSVISSIHSFFLNRHKTIAFDAINSFHLSHLMPIINQLSRYKKQNIIVIYPEELPLNIPTIKQYTDISNIPFWQKIDLLIKTDFNPIPYWLSTNTIFFGHGIGPKLSYQASSMLSQFDYIFTACAPIHDIQSTIFDPKKMFKIGLPILDNLQSNTSLIHKHFELNSNKPSVLYAPSWCSYPEHIADIDKALEQLNKVVDANVVISPHPLLLQKDRCSGKDFFANHEKYENLFFNFPNSPFSTLELCHCFDMTISDISSIMFESMALGKITLFENNKGIFEKFSAEKVYEQLIQACLVVNWDTFDPERLINNIDHDTFKQPRESFINGYIFHRLQSTDAFIKTVLTLLKR